ncbi:MAG TPA: DUF4384 domain-containing protein [Pyrinomonadaceae bacterium]|nr:DUF4384 domain-containing protein [Pyrinomonadaceae bacterium]
MKSIVTRCAKVYLLLACVLVLGAGHGRLLAGAQAQQDGETQEEPEQLRKIWDDGLKSARPPSAKQNAGAQAAGKPQTPKRPQHTYVRKTTPTQQQSARLKNVGSAKKAVAESAEAGASERRVVGVTLWRLRPSAPGDEARMIVQEPSQIGPREWTPERVEAETPFASGERVRIGIESPRAGFLYVINRERYADGSSGEPKLIFPTTRTRDGNNHVRAGHVVEIPARSDSVPYFTMKPGRRDQVAEDLTVIVTDQPLVVNGQTLDLVIGRQPLPLDDTTVREWELKWKREVGRLELVGGRGRAWTKAEQEAGGGTRELTQEESLPQSIYYVSAKRGDPVLVKVSLLYKNTSARR